MHYYKISIQYEGTNYAGFQWQNGAPTIQDELNKALSKIIPNKVTTVAASRTDTGVHAIEQIVKISSEDEIDCSSFIKKFNELLPSDIQCNQIEVCPGDFKPSVNTLSKEYRYFFTNNSQVSKEDMQFVANIANKLDFDSMQFCLKALIGTHDFCNFYSSGSNVKSTTRSILKCELKEINPADVFSHLDLFQIPENLTKCYELKIEANGFLKQMIRHIVSALWMVGSGKLSREEFISFLNGPKSSKQLWKVASPNGLYLYKINY